MPIIRLQTEINAPIERCFQLALSIDLHKASTANTNEEAIAGVTSGIIGLNETVTWRAKHFGFYFKMTSKITALTTNISFTDEMIKGPFKKLHHQHLFVSQGNTTLMEDVFEFEAPFGLLGKLTEQLVLIKYLNRFLILRNAYIKQEAELKIEH